MSISEDTQDNLRNTYNPDGSTLRRAQNRMLEMLQYVDSVCKTQHISYRLDSGNVLGAVRHKGFIPWDDDIDLGFSLHDYKRFCNYLRKNPHPDFVLQSPETDNNYFLPWNKLRDLRTEYVLKDEACEKEKQAFEMQTFKGLQIDLFPFENNISSSLQHFSGKLSVFINFELAKRNKFLAKIAFNVNRYLIFPLFRLFGKFFGNKNFCMYSYGTWFYKRYKLVDIVPYKKMEFEGALYPVPANPEGMCSTAYGNFMELPPEDKRIWHAKDIIFLDD